MRRRLALFVSPQWVLSSLVLAVVTLLAGFVLDGTMHVITIGHITFLQFSENVGVGGYRHSLPFVSLFWLAIALALPGMGWGLWFLIHWDSPQKPENTGSTPSKL